MCVSQTDSDVILSLVDSYSNYGWVERLKTASSLFWLTFYSRHIWKILKALRVLDLDDLLIE